MTDTPRPSPLRAAKPRYPTTRDRRSHHFQLDNGLDLVIIPDRRVPVATHMIWYRNGSADDSDRASQGSPTFSSI